MKAVVFLLLIVARVTFAGVENLGIGEKPDKLLRILNEGRPGLIPLVLDVCQESNGRILPETYINTRENIYKNTHDATINASTKIGGVSSDEEKIAFYEQLFLNTPEILEEETEKEGTTLVFQENRNGIVSDVTRYSKQFGITAKQLQTIETKCSPPENLYEKARMTTSEGGSQATSFAINTITDEEVVIKSVAYDNKEKCERIKNENNIYEALDGSGAVTDVKYFGPMGKDDNKKLSLILQAEDINLENLRVLSGDQLDMKSLLVLISKLTKLAEALHKFYVLHMDFKAENVVLEKVTNSKPLGLKAIDFELSQLFRKNGTPIKPQDADGMSPLTMGIPRYMKLDDKTLSKLDPETLANLFMAEELESVGYITKYLRKGVLPWMSGPNIGHKESLPVSLAKLAFYEDNTKLEKFNCDFPGLLEFLTTVYSYSKTGAAIDYDLLCSYIYNEFVKRKFEFDGKFSIQRKREVLFDPEVAKVAFHKFTIGTENRICLAFSKFYALILRKWNLVKTSKSLPQLEIDSFLSREATVEANAADTRSSELKVIESSNYIIITCVKETNNAEDAFTLIEKAMFSVENKSKATIDKWITMASTKFVGFARVSSGAKVAFVAILSGYDPIAAVNVHRVTDISDYRNTKVEYPLRKDEELMKLAQKMVDVIPGHKEGILLAFKSLDINRYQMRILPVNMKQKQAGYSEVLQVVLDNIFKNLSTLSQHINKYVEAKQMLLDIRLSRIGYAIVRMTDGTFLALLIMELFTCKAAKHLEGTRGDDLKLAVKLDVSFGLQSLEDAMETPVKSIDLVQTVNRETATTESVKNLFMGQSDSSLDRWISLEDAAYKALLALDYKTIMDKKIYYIKYSVFQNQLQIRFSGYKYNNSDTPAFNNPPHSLVALAEQIAYTAADSEKSFDGDFMNKNNGNYIFDFIRDEDVKPKFTCDEAVKIFVAGNKYSELIYKRSLLHLAFGCDCARFKKGFFVSAVFKVKQTPLDYLNTMRQKLNNKLEPLLPYTNQDPSHKNSLVIATEKPLRFENEKTQDEVMWKFVKNVFYDPDTNRHFYEFIMDEKVRYISLEINKPPWTKVNPGDAQYSVIVKLTEE